MVTGTWAKSYKACIYGIYKLTDVFSVYCSCVAVSA